MPGSDQMVGVTFTGASEGPTPVEERFSKEELADLDRLFDRCRAAFMKEYPNWVEEPFPENWRDSFQLSGLSIPVHGDPMQDWEIDYSVDKVPAGAIASH